jgi:hypothetical protein
VRRANGGRRTGAHQPDRGCHIENWEPGTGNRELKLMADG